MVVVTVDAEEARGIAGPDLVSRGVFYLPESGAVMEELKRNSPKKFDDCSVEGIRETHRHPGGDGSLNLRIPGGDRTTP